MRTMKRAALYEVDGMRTWVRMVLESRQAFRYVTGGTRCMQTYIGDALGLHEVPMNNIVGACECANELAEERK